MDGIHETQVGIVLPYQFDPDPSPKTCEPSDDSDDSGITSSSDEDVAI